MKVLFVSASDRIGGAAIGGYRLHQALQREGVHSEMLVLHKVTADPSVHRLAPHLDRLARARRRLGAIRHARRLRDNPRTAESGYWSLNLFAYPIADVINSFGADIVHLNWVGDNYLPIRELAKIKAPTVWTLQDMWAFTGGCHYAGDCLAYQKACGNCPQLVAGAADDMSARAMREKRLAWSQLSLNAIALSNWLADCARASALFKDKRVEVIGNPIDPEFYKPLDKMESRRAFNLPLDKQLILFGAVGGTSDKRKGFRFLREALDGITAENVELVIFGSAYDEDLQLGIATHQVGRLQDDVSLNLLYSAADVYVLPTVQEALGNTLVEALACGTPCVTFDGSGAVDIVQHRRSGYVARLKDCADLLTGIEWVLARSWPAQDLHKSIIARYGNRHIAGQTIKLYQSLLGDIP